MRPDLNSHRRQLIFFYALCIAHCAFILSCANIGSPDGGPYDETPPRLVRTTPHLGTANADKLKKITLEFDELVKLENAYENVVISPPQIEQPNIEANGKKVIVTLYDTLKPNMTYTIDFADAIVDNNEGNPFGNFAYTFSTGPQVDTLQVSGNVLDASNLEPVKGILVGLFHLPDEEDTSVPDSLQPDSLFLKQPFQRISRTNGSGQFTIKGIAPGRYRIYALADQNQNYCYDQPAEMIAFTDRVIQPTCRPDMRADTLWHDSIHYDTIISTAYTHFLPDDITLLAFTTEYKEQHLLKSERPILQQFSLFFTAPADTLPTITPLNFTADPGTFVIDASQHYDTIHYWIRDSLIYNIDTLEMKLDYLATDTTGLLQPATDTLRLASKVSKERLAKQQKEKYEAWVKECRQKQKEARKAAKRAAKKEEEQTPPEAVATDSIPPTPAPTQKKSKKSRKADDEEELDSIPPMPEEFLTLKVNGALALTPDKNIDIEFTEPIDSVDLSKVHFSVKVDTLFLPTRHLMRPVAGEIMKYRLYAEWECDSTYQLEVDTGAFVSIYGKRNEAFKRTIPIKSLDTFSTLFVQMLTGVTNGMVQLLNGSDKVVKTVPVKGNKVEFYFVTPGTYYMRLFSDLNGNGRWDTGDFATQLQPEPVYYYPDPLTLKAQWEITQTWSPTARPLPKQKPAAITKQKPDKEKTVRNRNADRPQK